MKTSLVIAFGLAAFCGASSAWAAVTVVDDKEHDVSFKVSLILQAQVQFTQDGAPNGKSWSTDFFLRRARLLLFGQATKNFTYFFTIDQPNWGKGGDFTTSAFVQDVVLTYEPCRQIIVDAGLLAPPFMHNTLESAAWLNAIDYHAALLHYPAGMGKNFRDTGVQVRGLLFNDRLHYRAGVFEGVRGPAIPANAPTTTLPLNEDAEPRVAAMVRLNLLGAEDKYLMPGITLGETPTVSVGVGYDFQRHATRIPNGISDHSAISGDIFADYPFSADDELVAKGAIMHWGEGTNNVASGLAAFGEAGFRHVWFEPVIGVDWFHAEHSLDDYYAVRGGLNFWIRKYTTNIKAEMAYIEDDAATGKKRGPVGTVQWQIVL